MAPAVAMAPPAPPRFRDTGFDRAIRALHLAQPSMMILRDIMRWPLRALLSALGIALATSVLVAANFFDDAFDEMIDIAFDQSNRQDAMLLFAEDVPLAAVDEVGRLPGVLVAEGQQSQPAELRHGHLAKRVLGRGARPGADLSRIVDDTGRVVEPPPGAIVLSDRLAKQLELRAGDRGDRRVPERQPRDRPPAGRRHRLAGLRPRRLRGPRHPRRDLPARAAHLDRRTSLSTTTRWPRSTRR